MKKTLLYFKLTAASVAASVSAVTVCFSAIVSNADDVATIGQIREAWQHRQSEVNAFESDWSYNPQQGQIGDPLATPKSELLVFSGNQMRHECKDRYYDLDGGPNGSKSWQTSVRIETYSPSSGWKSLIRSDIAQTAVSGTINHHPKLILIGLDGRGLLTFWFRAMNNELTLIDADNWQVSTDDNLAKGCGNRTVVTQQIDSHLLVLDLDGERGFLPMRSRFGMNPGVNKPFLDYTECLVTCTEDTSWPEGVRPVSWVTNTYRRRRLSGRPVVATIGSWGFSPSLQRTSFDVQFPKGIFVADESLPDRGRTLAVANQNKHGVPTAYWFAVLFCGLLVFAFIVRMRKHTL